MSQSSSLRTPGQRNSQEQGGSDPAIISEFTGLSSTIMEQANAINQGINDFLSQFQTPLPANLRTFLIQECHLKTEALELFPRLKLTDAKDFVYLASFDDEPHYMIDTYPLSEVTHPEFGAVMLVSYILGKAFMKIQREHQDDYYEYSNLDVLLKELNYSHLKQEVGYIEQYNKRLQDSISRRLHANLMESYTIYKQRREGDQSAESNHSLGEETPSPQKNVHFNMGFPDSSSPYQPHGTDFNFQRHVLNDPNISSIKEEHSFDKSDPTPEPKIPQSSPHPIESKDNPDPEQSPEAGPSGDGTPSIPTPTPLTPRQRNAQQFMDIIRSYGNQEKEEKRATLPSRYTWDGDYDKFEEFMDQVEGFYAQVGAGYLFTDTFQICYDIDGADCYINFPDFVKSKSQVLRDVRALYGALKGACKKGVGKTFILNERNTQDGLKVWMAMCKRYKDGGDRKTRISQLELAISTRFNRNFSGGLKAWIQSYENSFAELANLNVPGWDNDENRKRRLLQNVAAPGSQWSTYLEGICETKNFQQTCEYLRAHAIRGETYAKANATANARQLQTEQPSELAPNPSKQDFDMTSLAKELVVAMKASQLQDHVSRQAALAIGGDKQQQIKRLQEIYAAKVSSIPQETWDKLPIDIKRLILRERKREQEELKKQAANPKTKEGQNQQKEKTSPLPKQYGRSANLATSKEEVQDQQMELELTEEEMVVDEFLNNLYDDEDSDDLETTAFMAPTVRTVYVSHTKKKLATCFNSLSFPTEEHASVLDDGADTCVLGKGWKVISEDAIRRANVYGFDKENAARYGLPIVSAVTTVVNNGQKFLIRANEAVFNARSEHTLLSEYQLRDYGTKVESKAIKHGGEQLVSMDGKDIFLGIKNCLAYFRHRLPTEEELSKLVPINITQGNEPWDPRDERHTMGEAERFKLEVEKLAKADAEAEAEEEENSKFSYYLEVDADFLEKEKDFNYVKIDSNAAIQHLEDLTSDIELKSDLIDELPHMHRALPEKVDYDKLSRYFLYRPKRIIKKTLQNTTQLVNPIIHSPMRRYLKSRTEMLRYGRLNEAMATDTYFAITKSLEGYWCSQAFYGVKSRRIEVRGMKTEAEFYQVYQDFLREVGIPHTLRRDNARSEGSERVRQLNRDLIIADEFTEPYSPWQNPAENRGVKFLKAQTQIIMNRVGAPSNLWFCCQEYLCLVHNLSAHPLLDWKTPMEVSRGDRPDISQILQFYWYEPVFYYDPIQHPESTEKPGYFVGIAKNIGDILTYKILTADKKQILPRSVVRSARDPKAPNRRVKFKEPIEVSESYDPHEFPKDSHPSLKPKKYFDVEEIKKPDQPPEQIRHKGIIQLNSEEELKPFNPQIESEMAEPIYDPDESSKTSKKAKQKKKPKEVPKDGVSSRTRSRINASANIAIINQATIDKYAFLGNIMKLVPTALLFILIAPIPTKDPRDKMDPDQIPDMDLDLGKKENKAFEKSFNKLDRKGLKQLKYVQAMDLADEGNDPDFANRDLWNVKLVESHRWRKKGGCFVKCRWKDPNKSSTWVSMFALALQDPIPILNYAKQLHLLDQYPFKVLVQYCSCSGDAPSQLVRAFKAKMTPTAPKFKFGIQVPYGVKMALYLDKINGNNNWKEAIKKELDQLSEYNVFRTLNEGEVLSKEYKQVPYHFVFDVKFDLRCKARLVADGNWTDVIREDIYSGVIGIETVRIGFLIGELNQLKCCAGDVGNAYLNGFTKEKIYIIAGPEFGPELEGKILVIVKALYGLRTSAARFHEHLTEVLRILGYKPTKADSNLFYMDKDDHYEYIASYVDDILIWSRNPMEVMKALKEIYTMKGVGIPEYYLGGDVENLDEHWNKENVALAISAKTYISNVIPKFEKLFNMTFKSIKTPMDSDYHPELDDSPFLSQLDASKFRSIIGSINWIITLGRFDVQFATMSLSRFSMAPREGHLKAAQRILTYLKTFSKGRIIMDNSYPDHSKYPTEEHGNWKEFYPDAEEDVPHDSLNPKGKPVRMTVYVDADHAHDQITRRSVTGIVAFLNNTPIRWISKRQKTVETSTYGSELIAARIATELIMELRYTLRMMGVPIDGPALMLGDNMSVVLNTSVPSSVLKKKHLAIGYHRVREAIACGILKFAHIRSDENIADILTKPLPNPKFYPLVKSILFRVPIHICDQP